MNQALVTGGSGFIGRHLVRLLIERGYRVRCLVRPTSSIRHLRRAGAEVCSGSLTQAVGLTEAVADCDVVFHLAGLTRALSRAELMRVNGLGTWQVARACSLRADPPVLVTVSSLAAAGPSAPGKLRTEADSPFPISAYGQSKRAGETAAELWAGRVPTTIVRPGVVFGPWDRDLRPMFQSIARIGIHPVPTFRPPPLSVIYVEDLAEFLLLSAEKGRRLSPQHEPCEAGLRPPGYYFACLRQYPTYADLGRLVARAFGRRHLLVLHLCDPLPWLVAGAAEVFGRLRREAESVNVDKMREAYADSWASCPAAAEEELGFRPAWPLDERIEQTARWYRDRRWL